MIAVRITNHARLRLQERFGYTLNDTTLLAKYIEDNKKRIKVSNNGSLFFKMDRMVLVMRKDTCKHTGQKVYVVTTILDFLRGTSKVYGKKKGTRKERRFNTYYKPMLKMQQV